MKLFPTLLIITLLILPLVSAQTVNFITAPVAPGEVFQAEIIAKEKISPTDIKLFNPYGYPAPFGVNFIVLDENYYFISAAIPENSLAGTYNLNLKDEGFNFQISEPKESYAVFSPIFIVYRGEEEYIKIKIDNHGLLEKEYTISSAYDAILPSVNSLTIPAKSTKSFYIQLDKLKIKKSLITNLLINEYTIPIYIVKDIFPTQVFSKETAISKDEIIFYTVKDSQETQINYINNILTKQTTLEGELLLKNNLESPIKNLTLILTGNLDKIVKLDKYSIKEIKPGESVSLKLTINEDKDVTEKLYKGSLVLGASELPLNFNIEESIAEEEIKEPESLVVEEKTEKIQETKEESKPKSYKKYFGYLIIILLAGVLYYYYFGKKEHKKEIKFSDFINKFKK